MSETAFLRGRPGGAVDLGPFSLWRGAFAMASPPGPRARLTVTMYHRVLARPDPLFPEVPDAAAFEADLRRLRIWFNVLPLEAAIERLDAGTLPAGALAITFDDGYADNCDVAVPVLERLGLTATFFVATGFLDGGRMWNDTVIESVRRCAGPSLDLAELGLGSWPIATPQLRRHAIEQLLGRIKYLPPAQRDEVVSDIAVRSGARLPTDLMLTSAQVRDMHERGMTIGAHTVSHPILSNLAKSQARAEIADSKSHLERLLDTEVKLFAYPNGKPGDDYRDVHADMARDAGFRAAFSTVAGVVSRNSARHQLPRFSPWGPTPTRIALQLLRNLMRGASRG
jgi:peptidoglycan/xylan/chitin deacetylase (PgdA/CDA1 family)